MVEREPAVNLPCAGFLPAENTAGHGWEACSRAALTGDRYCAGCRLVIDTAMLSVIRRAFIQPSISPR